MYFADITPRLSTNASTGHARAGSRQPVIDTRRAGSNHDAHADGTNHFGYNAGADRRGAIANITPGAAKQFAGEHCEE